MSDERRKYLRVFFEETIQVEAQSWSDPMATGLDISLNGVRFHCERSLEVAEEVAIVFPPTLKLVGQVRWCWPIEWYYQAAVEFNTADVDQSLFRQYIMDATGEPYPEYIDEGDDEFEEENLSETEGDVFLPEVEKFEELPTENLSPFSFIDKRVLLIEPHYARQDKIREYLTERCQFFVEVCEDYSVGLDSFHFSPPDAVVLSWTDENATIAQIQKFKDYDPESKIIVLAGLISLESRLRLLHLGASDVLTFPLQIASVAQSILVHLDRT